MALWLYLKDMSYTKKFGILSLVLFLFLLPLSYSINFYQNDDWVYYLNTDCFLHGNFQLHQYLGPTFFLQGILGAIFSKFFGLNHLPILTLIIASLNFYLLAIICFKFLKRTFLESLLGALLFFVTPIHVYLLWGFMTGIYFLFFLLLGIYFFKQYEYTEKNVYLFFTFLISFLGLLVRQTSLIIPLSIGLYLAVNKKYKLSFISFLVFLSFFGYLNYIFPLTAVMKRAALQYHHLTDINYMYALTYGSILLVVAYLFPMFLAAFDFKQLIKNKWIFIAFILFSIFLFIFLNKYFHPDVISWGEFPYFENTVERTGFYPRGVHGTKYQFIGNFDLYIYWDIASKILLSLVISYFLLFKKIKLNIFTFLIGTYVFVLNLTETHYDRYLLELLVLSLLYLYTFIPNLNKYKLILVSGFILFITFLMYQFTMDFYLVNKYIWNKSVQLVHTENLDPKVIHGTNAWKLLNKNESRAYIYMFSYDSQQINDKFVEQYYLIETHEIEYPLSIFINPRIYLYKHK